MLGLAAGAAFSSKAQDMKAPAGVQQSFAAQYPDVRIRTWEQQGGTWMVTFKDKDDRTKDMAYHGPDGQWIKTETKIPMIKDLPVAVNMAWKRSEFASWPVAGMKEVKYPDKDVYVLKVEANCGPDGSLPGDCVEAYRLYYDKDGALLRQSLVQNDDPGYFR